MWDVLTRTASAPVREPVPVTHPLQPFDARNHTPGALVGAQPFSFDTATLAAATAARRPGTGPGPLLAAPLVARPLQDVALADLHAFLAHPVRAFLRQRLEVTAPLQAEELKDAIPTDLDGLDRWKVGDRMLAELLRGVDPDT